MSEKNIEPESNEEYVRLIMKHDRVIRSFLRSLLPTITDVDEVMQEVSVVAWRKFDQLDHSENFVKWVCMIARYEVLMYRRKKARDRFVLSEEIENLIIDEGLEELELREQQVGALKSCLRELPDERQQLVVKVYSDQSSIKMIAEQIGKTPEALYQILTRTRQMLLRCIETKLAAEGNI